MKTLTISQVRAHLPEIVHAVARDREEVVITRHGEPLARIASCQRSGQKTDTHPLRGLPIRVAEDFDEPLPDRWSAMDE